MIRRKCISAADLFCGAGGSSTGFVRAAEARNLRVDLLAVNHWQTAIDTHTANHPWARHACADLTTLDPNKAIPGGHLNVLLASPECTHHSNARGGKPCSDQSRASAWHVLHWAERLRVDNIVVENVREFEHWGPLDANNRPIKSRRGETFNAFIRALQSLGYDVDYRILNAADYGDATARNRLFIQACRHGKVSWPEPTHAGNHRGAKEIIDWSILGQDIRDRSRPLAPKTLARIEAGLRKFGGEAFISVLRGTSPGHVMASAHSVDDPLGTICAGGQHMGLCEPFIMNVAHQGSDASRCRSTDEPLPTFHAGGGSVGLCEPFVIGQQSKSAPRSTDEPLPTVATKGAIALVQPFVMNVAHQGGDSSRCRSIDQPLSTIPAGHRGELGLVEPFLIPMEHSGRQPVRSTGKPLPTITTARGGSFGLCTPFVTQYYGTAKNPKSVEDPLGTVTTKGRFGLVTANQLGIRFRMLRPHELAAAMGLEDYTFCGNQTEQIKQIGNAVARRTAQALCGNIMDRMCG